MKRTRRLAFLLVLCLLVGMVALPVSASAAAKVKLSKTKVTLKVKQTVTLKLKGATGKVTWSTSDKKVATVSKKGKVKAVAGGACKITAKNGKKKYTCKVTVDEKIKKITMDKTLTLKVGGTATLEPKISPATATNQKLKWKSSNADVVKVSSKGEVTALKEGTATITATAKDGSKKKAACEVTVNKKSDALTWSKVWITPENWSDYFNLEILPRYDDDGNLTDSYSVKTSWKDRNTFVSRAEYDFLVKYTIDCKATNGADAVREGERTVRKESIQGGTEGGPNYVSYDPGSLKYTVTGTSGYAYIYDWDAVESYTTRTISELKREEVDVITLKNGNTFRGWEHGKITWPPEG